MVVNSFKPSGLYRLFAYLLGLTKFKSVDFFDEHVQLNSKSSTISINFSQVTKTRIGGILFINLRIIIFFSKCINVYFGSIYGTKYFSS